MSGLHPTYDGFVKPIRNRSYSGAALPYTSRTESADTNIIRMITYAL
jgi:hypothetical protein